MTVDNPPGPFGRRPVGSPCFVRPWIVNCVNWPFHRRSRQMAIAKGFCHTRDGDCLDLDHAHGKGWANLGTGQANQSSRPDLAAIFLAFGGGLAPWAALRCAFRAAPAKHLRRSPLVFGGA